MTYAAAIALCATVGAAIESENIVGYQVKTAAEGGLHFLTSTFLDMNGSKAINDLYQMDESVTTGAADLQLLDKDGIATAQYKWLKKGTPAATGVTFKEGQNGVWSTVAFVWDEEEEEDVAVYTPISDDVTIDRGLVIQFSYAGNKSITFAGAVPESDVTITNATDGLIFVGNPFPQAIDIQDVQMDATVATGLSDLQVLDKDGIATAKYKWLKKGSSAAAGVTFEEGQNGLWSVQTFVYDEEEEEDVPVYTPVAKGTVFLDGADGVQISCAAETSVTILAPYSL